ncbi:MAG: dihydrolipoyl dehydrogenase [Bacillota bacterium]
MIYDLIVIGGGPAGYTGAARAGRAGMSVLLIEKTAIGGVCLNEGCIPSKTLLHSAKIHDYAAHGEKYGVTVKEAVLNHRMVWERKNKVVKMLASGVKGSLKKNNVTVAEGFAEISGKSSEGYRIRAGGRAYTGKRLLIATGSVPLIPPIPGVDDGLKHGLVLTNREILDLQEIPPSLAVIGGGVVGLEMASYFNTAGSRVTVLEMLDHVGGSVDREISGFLLDQYRKKGVGFVLNAKVTEIKENSVVYEHEGERLTLQADKVLLSAGRKPDIEGLGLERIGLETECGCIKTDERGCTNLPEVYAAGDVNGFSMLAHTAHREAEVCVNNMLGKKDLVRYGMIPYCIFTNPEVAGAGETEETAREKGIDYEAVKVSMRYSGRFIAENEGGDGICKLILDKKSRRLLGMHMIANYATEIIYGAGMMLEMEMRAGDIRELVFPHPTVSEIIREAVFEAEGGFLP